MTDTQVTATDQPTVVKTTALFIAFVAVFATAIRALVAREIDPAAVPTTLGCVALLVLVNRYVHSGGSAVVGAWWILGVVMAIYAYLTVSSHGFLGSIIYAAPVVPLLAWVMLNRAATRVMTIATGLFLMLLLSLHLAGSLEPDAYFPEEIRYVMKSVVMVLTLIAVYWVVAFQSVEHRHQQTLDRPDMSRDEHSGLLRSEAMADNLRRELMRGHRGGQPLSLMLIGLDNSVSSEVQSGVADAIKYSLKRATDFLGHHDQGRFAAILPDTGLSGAVKVAEKFRTLMDTLDIPQGEELVQVSVSLAVVTVPGDTLRGPDQVVDQAERLLEQALQGGGNRVLSGEVS